MTGHGAAARAAPAGRTGGPVNAAAGGQPDASFPRTVRKAFKAITSATQETTLLRIPWGPRLSVLFDPRGGIGFTGGSLVVYALAESTQFELQRVPFAATSRPIRMLDEAACDTYIVAAILGTALPPGATQVESYVYAGTYAWGL